MADINVLPEHIRVRIRIEGECWLVGKRGCRPLIGSAKLARFVFELTHQPLGSLHALHTCDEPACINYDHLFAGTHSDNMNDMHAKGRGRKDWHPTNEQRLKYAAGRLGKKDTEETRQKKAASQRLRRKRELAGVTR